jgi:glycosyltransferase involved in cell wall biosynthesis
MISLCTTIKNRLHHLQATLPRNLQDNPKAEFVIVDFSSTDGLHDWIQPYLDRVVYAHVPGMQFYDSSFSKNIAHQLATGGIVCNVDADNYTGPGFTDWLEANMTYTSVARCRVDKPGPHGRLALAKPWFLALGGYDETMRGWGHDDLDLERRAIKLGLRPIDIPDHFLHDIGHSNEDRLRWMVPGVGNVVDTEGYNGKISTYNLQNGFLVANRDKSWGIERIGLSNIDISRPASENQEVLKGGPSMHDP